jgi:hypothetical protein
MRILFTKDTMENKSVFFVECFAHFYKFMETVKKPMR